MRRATGRYRQDVINTTEQGANPEAPASEMRDCPAQQRDLTMNLRSGSTRRGVRQG
jgi:hypothetical protein